MSGKLPSLRRDQTLRWEEIRTRPRTREIHGWVNYSRNTQEQTVRPEGPWLWESIDYGKRKERNLRGWYLRPAWRGLPWWLSGKESTCQWRRCGFDSWVRKIPCEKEMTTHSSIFAWEIPWTEEPGMQQSMGLQRVRHNLVTEQWIIILLNANL